MVHCNAANPYKHGHMRTVFFCLFIGFTLLLSGCPGLIVRPTPTYYPETKKNTKEVRIHRTSEGDMRPSPRRESHEETRWTPECDPTTFTDPYKACQYRKDIVLPYPVQRILRGFGKCVSNPRHSDAFSLRRMRGRC